MKFAEVKNHLKHLHYQFELKYLRDGGFVNNLQMSFLFCLNVATLYQFHQLNYN